MIGIDDKAKEVAKKLEKAVNDYVKTANTMVIIDEQKTDEEYRTGIETIVEQIIAEALAFAIEHHEEFTVTECSIGSGGHRLLDGLLRARVGVTETVLGAGYTQGEDVMKAFVEGKRFEIVAPGEPPRRVPSRLESPLADPILQFFVYAQLPPHLQEISAPFCELAHKLVEVLPLNEERYAALHRLLEAKDAAVRARIYK